MKNEPSSTSSTISDLEGIKARMKSTWMAGDFGRIANILEDAADKFITRRDLKPRLRVLDVACGTGNLAIPAAKAGAVVTGVDIAPNLLEQARERAKREGVKVTFDEGDAEALPYEDASFDLVISMFGAMFAPRPDLVATELLRVCRPGGQIAMANWAPRGFAGQMTEATAKYAPPPQGVQSFFLWGDEETVRQRFHDGVADLQCTPVMADLKHPFPVSETVEYFRAYLPPTQRAFAVLPEDEQQALRRDLETLFAKHNRATDGTTWVEAEYLEVSVTKN